MNFNSKSKICFDKLLNAKNNDEIIDIIENAGVTFKTLKSSINNYCVTHNKNDLKEDLKNKLNIYNDYYNKKNNNKGDYIIAYEVINKFFLSCSLLYNKKGIFSDDIFPLKLKGLLSKSNPSLFSLL